MSEQDKLPGYIEVHDADCLMRYFQNGGDPNEVLANGMPLLP
jgi:hypothetical protein